MVAWQGILGFQISSVRLEFVIMVLSEWWLGKLILETYQKKHGQRYLYGGTTTEEEAVFKSATTTTVTEDAVAAIANSLHPGVINTNLARNGGFFGMDMEKITKKRPKPDKTNTRL
nr:hypothetical protein [Tanacetum cinerariifolium]